MYMTTGKTIALTIWTCFWKMMSLLFNMLSSFVVAFFPRIKRLSISWWQSLSGDFGVPQNKVCHCFHCFPIYLQWSDGTGFHDFNILNVCLVKAMVFPVVMDRRESWTIKKAECWRIDAFELWCWRRLLRVPWIARRSNQSILKEISPEYSLEGLMLKLKLQYFGHLMRRADSLEKILMLGKIEGRRRRGQPRMRCLDGITNLMGMNLSKL